MQPEILLLSEIISLLGEEWRTEITTAIYNGEIKKATDQGILFKALYPVYVKSVSEYFINKYGRDLIAEKTHGTAKELPTHLDTSHPLHSQELAIAIEAWEAVLKSNPDRPKKGTRKQLIESWLRGNKDLNQSEIERITTMLNPDKTGGAPKTE